MLFLLAMLAAAAVPAAAPAQPAQAAAKPVQSCMPHGITFAEVTSKSRGLRRLGEEPPANQYLAVVRNVGGCPEPAVVRTGIRR